MDIPYISDFVEGLKLFFVSKRLRWFTLIFFIGALLTTIWENIGLMVEVLRPLVYVGGIFPIYFMLAAFMSLLGLVRFVVSDESYMKSFIYTIIWGAISVFVLIGMVVFTFGLFATLFIGVAFLGWISFQSYFASRTSLGLAKSVDLGKRSIWVGILFGAIYIFNYIIVAGTIIIGYFLFLPLPAALVVAILGGLLVYGFNFVNGLILMAERNKSTASGVSLLGLFVSLYSAYFLYNVLRGFDASLDIVGIAISIAFILYTMSGIGRSLASRAELDTRWKISKEFAASLTYFLASGFIFVDTVFSLFVPLPSLQGIISDVVKLFVFPFVALLMVLNYLRKSRKALKYADEVPDEIPVAEEDEPIFTEEEPAVLDEPEEEEDPLLAEEEDVGGDLQDIADEETAVEDSFEESE
ncbi:MAG: hypothetical protein ACW98U_02735 [Candidatus Thorarchaeota archaeon]|jgi:hypothetical protein